MAKKQNSIKVIKIPLDSQPVNYPQLFPTMPRMYLELLENKNKIKQTLINKDYVPDIQNKQESVPITDVKRPVKSTSKQEEPVQKKKIEKSKIDKLNELELSDTDSESMPKRNPSKNDIKDTLSEIDTISDISSDSSSEDEDDKRSKYKRQSDNSSISSNDSENIDKKLEELLNDSSSEASSYTPQSRESKYSRHRDRSGHSVSKSVNNEPPSLTELKNTGAYVPRKTLRDINRAPTMSEQDEEDFKRELLFKFKLLKKSYPSAEIPEYTIHSDHNVMLRSYEDTVKQLSLDTTVERYKTYLIYAFAGCEFLFGNFLGFDMQGFTQQQLISMKSYERLLIELGEKSYVPTGSSSWPVELRLLGLVILNAGFFVMSKMIMKKSGADLMGLVAKYGNNNTNFSHNSSQQRSKPMKRPNIDLNSIPELNEINT